VGFQNRRSVCKSEFSRDANRVLTPHTLPNAKVLLHQLWGGFEGQASDIEIHAREAIALTRRLEEIVAEHGGQPLEKVSTDMERDYFMTAEEAKEYGLIDNVLARRFESGARAAV
jgi:ATP-dependent Clp protease protease subunit